MSKGILIGKEIDDEIEVIITKLNTIDFSEDIKNFKSKNILDLILFINKKYPYKDEHCDELLECLTEDEIIDYLKEKYNIKTRNVNYEYIETYIE